MQLPTPTILTRRMPFAEAMARLSHLRQVSLSATGFYRTPGIGWDKRTFEGRPFHYYAFGMAVSEVEVDMLTGRHRLLRTDILHDVGESMNPGIDLGQIREDTSRESAGCTTEEMLWDDERTSPDPFSGHLQDPDRQDVPLDFRVEILPGGAQRGHDTEEQSGGRTALHACLLRLAGNQGCTLGGGRSSTRAAITLPATREVILAAAEGLRWTCDRHVATAQDQRR